MPGQDEQTEVPSLERVQETDLSALIASPPLRRNAAQLLQSNWHMTDNPPKLEDCIGSMRWLCLRSSLNP